MQIDDSKYNRFNLVKEMYETVGYINSFNPEAAGELYSKLPAGCRLMLTGEGSSRIFPGKNAVHQRLHNSNGPLILTESSTDLRGKNLDEFIVTGASNSGQTKELINLFRDLADKGHRHLYGLTCNRNTLLEKHSEMTFVIDAGVEKAVAATKSVVAQALFYDALLRQWEINKEIDTGKLALLFGQTLDLDIDTGITDAISNADMVFFTGNNNGVAEELTLKTNEIIRKKSAYLPGTYLLHGVEEVISEKDVIIMIDAYPDEYQKIKSIYTDSIGVPVIAVSSEPSPFQTVIIPAVSYEFEPYIKLAAGWNMLVEAGIALGVDPDKPQRARKIGNQATG